MINVNFPQPPQDFDEKVKTPGLAFLAKYPTPTNALWRVNRYWMHAHGALYKSLGGICSYCASFTPRRQSGSGLDHTSIDHFIPKSKDKTLAYDWSNYRLCRSRLNNRKGDYEDVTDPYVIQNGFFRINFSNFFMVPDATLPNEDKEKVEKTIARLALNDDESYVNERARVVYAYADGKLRFDEIRRFYPFIAMEIVSQNFDAVYMPIFARALNNHNVRMALAQQGLL